jgi:phytol kinase
MKKEYIRKSIHASLALLFALIALFASKELLIVFAVVLFVVFSVARALRFFNIARVPRVTFGELFFAVGVLAAVHLAWPNIALFQLSMFILALSDPIAALIGIPYGKHTYTILDEKRSYEGSIACFVTTFLILIGSHFK